ASLSAPPSVPSPLPAMCQVRGGDSIPESSKRQPGRTAHTTSSTLRHLFSRWIAIRASRLRDRRDDAARPCKRSDRNCHLGLLHFRSVTVALRDLLSRTFVSNAQCAQDSLYSHRCR